MRHYDNLNLCEHFFLFSFGLCFERKVLCVLDVMESLGVGMAGTNFRDDKRVSLKVFKSSAPKRLEVGVAAIILVIWLCLCAM